MINFQAGSVPKMGFQMTVMLATLIELEAIQEELPVFPSAKEVKFLKWWPLVTSCHPWPATVMLRVSTWDSSCCTNTDSVKNLLLIKSAKSDTNIRMFSTRYFVSNIPNATSVNKIDAPIPPLLRTKNIFSLHYFWYTFW